MKVMFNVKIIGIKARKGTMSTSTSAWLGCLSQKIQNRDEISKKAVPRRSHKKPLFVEGQLSTR